MGQMRFLGGITQSQPCGLLFALTDFFATDITNQRLRARQFNVGDGAT
jgi:hypothetical protein